MADDWLRQGPRREAAIQPTMSDPVIDLLKDLIAIDSVNPSLVPGAAGEGEIARAVAEHMRRLGLDVHLQEAGPGRPNVIGVLDGGVPGPSLMFCGHLDTVGVDGMSAPFDPAERDGRIYGRGSQDMKSGVAAMIDAARVAKARGFRHGRLIVAAVVDEEFASIGADALVREWHADAAIVTEPTDLLIAVGHKGFAWYEIETRGRAAHGSRPAEGRDAIVRMGRVLGRLEALDRELQSRPPDPILATASLHASTIAGGREWSVYPDACLLRVERRTVAGETAATGEQEINEILAGLRRDDPDFEGTVRTMFSRPAYAIAPGQALTRALRSAADAQGLTSAEVGMSFWTDAAALAEAGIPSLLFGPKGGGLHSSEEYVEAESVIACRDVLADLAMRWCRGE